MYVNSRFAIKAGEEGLEPNQPSALEAAALPIELLTCKVRHEGFDPPTPCFVGMCSVLAELMSRKLGMESQGFEPRFASERGRPIR